MVFLKPLREVDFQDIERLKLNQTRESQILDYKKDLIEDKELLKDVSAFANTQGGFLIFGIAESGQGGYPTEILEIELDRINTERLEQVILSNLQPRLQVNMVKFRHKDDPTKGFLIIQIPDSYLKPHINGRDSRFYKRFEFQATPMTEMEVDAYVKKLLENLPLAALSGDIIIIPTMLTHMIDTSDISNFKWMTEINLKPNGNYLRIGFMIPSTNGVKSQYQDEKDLSFEKVEIHRNGCIHYSRYFEEKENFKDIHDKIETISYFLAQNFCAKLLQTLQFSSSLYQRINYFGDVRIICNLKNINLNNSVVEVLEGYVSRKHHSQSNDIYISREFPTKIIESNYEQVASNIMNEIFNSFSIYGNTHILIRLEVLIPVTLIVEMSVKIKVLKGITSTV